MKFIHPIEAKPYFLIPDNLDFDSLVRHNPPPKELNRTAAHWLLDGVTAWSSTTSRMTEMPSSVIRKTVPNYKEYLRYFISEGVLETDNYYRTPRSGRRPKAIGYTFTDPFSRTPLKEIKNPCFRASDSQAGRGHVNNPKEIGTIHLREFARHRRDYDVKLTRKAEYWASTIEHSWFSSTDTNGRVYNPVTCMNKKLRPYLTIRDSNDLADLDIKTCQPYLLGWVAIQHGVERSEVDRWVETVQKQDIYDDFGERLCKAGEPLKERDDLKPELLRVFHSSNKHHSPGKKVFANWWPGIAKMLVDMKKTYNGAVACTLMALEADIMFGLVVPRLEAQEIVAFTVHDGILVRDIDKDNAVRILEDSCKEKTGISPEIKTKPLNAKIATQELLSSITHNQPTPLMSMITPEKSSWVTSPQ